MLVQLWLQLWPPEFPSWIFVKNKSVEMPRPGGQGGYPAKDPYKEQLGKIRIEEFGRDISSWKGTLNFPSR